METGVDITETSPQVGEDKIYVTLGNVFEENISVLLWALRFFRRKNICILHIHQPAQEICVMGGKFRIAGLDADEVKAHRRKEKKEMEDLLNIYLHICLQAGVFAETIHIEMDNIERGIVELIAQHGVKKLVMGAAADKHYTKNMTKLKSQKAKFVFEKAPISCHLWFVCKENLIVTRPERITLKVETPSPSLPDCPNSITGQPERSRNIPFFKSFSHGVGPRNPAQDHSPRRAMSVKSVITTGGSTPAPLAKSQSKKNELTNPAQELLKGAISFISRGRTTRRTTSSSSSAGMQTPRTRSPSSDCSSRLSVSTSAPNLRDERSDDYEMMVSSSCDSIENLHDSSPANELLPEKESESLNEEEEKKGRKEQLDRERQELENLKSQRDQVMEQLRIAEDQKVKLESQIADSDRMVADLVEKKVFSAAQQLVAIQKELEELQKLREAREGEFASLQKHQYFSVISALDIESATWNFDPSMKIGEGAFGNVYKGLFRKTPVAIKRFLHSLEGQSNSDFQREVDVLSKVRHPNLVTLIGACPEASSLVYEYLPNGSLEDRLARKDGTPPLSWRTRLRIGKEICSALIFLHSNEPHSIVHGDLKPSNILLDKNFVSKLGDFGIASFIARDENSTYTTTLCCTAEQKGTIAYIDPEFFGTGVLTPKADVYSFGVVLLQLLTGRPAIGLAMEVQFAIDQRNLNAMLDASAGDWPLFQAKELALMALRCCEVSRKNRPNLELEVWKLLRLLDTQI